MDRRMARGACGFTLIETLVVVSIIMILAAVLLPVYETVNKRAEATHCLANIRSLAMAVGAYAEDNDDRLVPARSSYGPSGSLGTSWDVLLLPYHHNQDLYLCLSDQSASPASNTVCYKHSYGINYEASMIGGYNGSALGLGEISAPTQLILFFELTGGSHSLGASYPVHGLTRVDIRHNGGSNYSFVDGHAKWYRPKQTEREGNLWLP